MKNRLSILKNKKGVTFVETMLAVAILAIIAVPLLSTVLASVRNNATAKEKTEAIALAEMAMGDIKAQAGLTNTSPPAIGITSGDLVSYHNISWVQDGVVNSNSAYSTNTINVTEADPADIELVITQVDSNGFVSFEVKDYYGNLLNAVYKFAVTDNIKLDVDQVSRKFIISTAGTTIASGNIINTSNMKMKVRYKDCTPSKAVQLKIVTYVKSDKSSDIFKVYVMDDDEANSGVSFIGRRNSQFLVKYLSSGGYGTINSLYKITVYIVKNSAAFSTSLDLSKQKNDVIYETSSYVKK